MGIFGQDRSCVSRAVHGQAQFLTTPRPGPTITGAEDNRFSKIENLAAQILTVRGKDKGAANMPETIDVEAIIQRAKELGAVESKLIDPRTVVTAPWVRLKCQFGCPHYSTRLCCPPYTPTPEQFQKVLNCYKRAFLFHSRGMEVSPGEIAFELEQELFFQGFYKALSLGAGPCRLCKECNLQQCIHPLQARPAMEACGIDVYATVRANGYPIEVICDRTEIPNRYGLILIE
jgi:predicted metal-binding protein